MKEYTIKPEDLAKRFNVTTKTILNWFNQMNLPGVKLGGIVRFNAEDIEDWIKSQQESKEDKK